MTSGETLCQNIERSATQCFKKCRTTVQEINNCFYRGIDRSLSWISVCKYQLRTFQCYKDNYNKNNVQ